MPPPSLSCLGLSPPLADRQILGLQLPKLLSHALGPTPPSSASLASAGLRARSSRAVSRASLTPAWHLPGRAKQHPKMLAGGGDRGVQGGEAEPNRGASGCSGGYSAARSRASFRSDGPDRDALQQIRPRGACEGNARSGGQGSPRFPTPPGQPRLLTANAPSGSSGNHREAVGVRPERRFPPRLSSSAHLSGSRSAFFFFFLLFFSPASGRPSRRVGPERRPPACGVLQPYSGTSHRAQETSHHRECRLVEERPVARE